MSYMTERFPVTISYKSRGGPRFSTDVVVIDSGAEQRNANWLNARHEYDAVFGVEDEASLELMLEFFHAAKGMAHTFPYKDWMDFKSCPTSTDVSSTDQTIVSAATSGQVSAQITKAYSRGGLLTVRDIFKVRASTLVLEVDGSVRASGFSLSSTSVASFAPALASGAVVKAGFEYDVACRFDTDRLAVSLDAYRIGSLSVPIVEVNL